MGEFLSAALEYAGRGWSVFPIRLDGDKKMPACRHWKPYERKRADTATLRRWFGVEGMTISRDLKELVRRSALRRMTRGDYGGKTGKNSAAEYRYVGDDLTIGVEKTGDAPQEAMG
jgi:hypothetical protein